MDASDMPQASVTCLYSIVDLPKLCERQKDHVTVSADTKKYLLYLTVRKLGPILAKKLLKKLVDRGDVDCNLADEDALYEVEVVLDYAQETEDEGAKEFYLIKWKSWPSEHNSWEPKEYLNCPDLLAAFHDTFKGTSAGGLKRKRLNDVMPQQPESKRRIDELMVQLMASPVDITPQKLLSVSSPAKASASLRHRIHQLIAPSSVSGTNSRGRSAPKARGDITNKRSVAYRKLKTEAKDALKAWEGHLNEINTDPAPIVIENKVDIEGPPDKFTYINDYKTMPGIDIPQDPIVGCQCVDCHDERKTCCGANAGAKFAYLKSGRVSVRPGVPIYECNKRCACDATCRNRVVQHGRKHTVCIFRTSNCRGWGVKAMRKIKRGAFVMEYVGEVITNEEAERRGKIYDAEGRTYLFDLDYNDGDCPFTVDAGFYGNVSHFVNHSCDPNLVVYGVWINHLDPRLPRIALFAKRDIAHGEELTFDYMMTGDTTDETPASSEDCFVVSDPAERTESEDGVESKNGPESKNVLESKNGVESEDRAESESKAESEDSDVVIVESPSQVDARMGSFSCRVKKGQFRMRCQCGAAKCRQYLF